MVTRTGQRGTQHGADPTRPDDADVEPRGTLVRMLISGTVSPTVRPRGSHPWREAWHTALYAAGLGFYVTRGGPAAHFTTATHGVTGAVLADALLRLWGRSHDDPPKVVVDIGAGRGELRPTSSPIESAIGVDVVDRPEALDPRIEWVRSPGGALLPDDSTGCRIRSSSRTSGSTSSRARSPRSTTGAASRGPRRSRDRGGAARRRCRSGGCGVGRCPLARPPTGSARRGRPDPGRGLGRPRQPGRLGPARRHRLRARQGRQAPSGHPHGIPCRQPRDPGPGRQL